MGNLLAGGGSLGAGRLDPREKLRQLVELMAHSKQRAMVTACLDGDLARARQLLSNMTPEQRHQMLRDGRSPLHHAAAAGSVGVLGLLLDFEAPIDIAAKPGGETPVFLAAAAGHAEVCQNPTETRNQKPETRQTLFFARKSAREMR